ncbi:EF-hand calcium-binding domain-containing protein 6 isoform X1 [Ochotona princeps]|uniref:EF-hand calcium-binding domain-containing protein 6 isoform X1 n=1 Tax=Ochotona princeps TaxID=9978 RepID=UPI0027149774|nr:EF-hand calcium-binding domain-containing protein 6 isoform X1 [Ochotona princeps]
MKRFGLKTTSKINWKQFLTSFNEPRGLEGNNVVPVAKKNGVCSRSQGHKEPNIVKLLRLAEDHCGALRKVLQAMKKVTREELRHMLNCTVVKLNDSEFRELMQVLDPRGSGMVSVSRFTELLEEKPTMKKLSPASDTMTPPPLAWDSVEEIVHDALARNLPAFYKMLQSYDLADTGLIGRNNFKKVMQIFCPFLTNEHIIKLSSRFQETGSGRVFYKKLLQYLDLHSPPSGSPALTPQAQPLSRGPPDGEVQQSLDAPKRTRPAEDESSRSRYLTKEEAIEKLRCCIQERDPTFRRHFLDVSKEPHRKISLREFKKVLEDSGMPMTEEQYALLAAKIGYRKEGMSYMDFTAGFEDAAVPGPKSLLAQTPTPAHTPPSTHFVTAEECLQLFPKRLAESFQDSYSAFFKMDTDRDGIISMHDLQRLLLHLLFNLKDTEFERFLGLLGLRLGVTLNFREFRGLFEQTPLQTDEAPQRFTRLKQKLADSELACEQAHQYLVTKAKNRWADLSKNFIETDSEGNGILRRRDIKNALYGFDIPLTPREFEKLWQSYDTEGRGHITYQEFLQKLGVAYSPAIHRPFAEDYFNFMGHFTKPQQVQEEMRELQQTHEAEKPRAAREKLLAHYEDISKALAQEEKSRSGSISMCRLQKVLRECGCPLKEEELASLLDSWGVSWQDRSINHADFLGALESSKLRPEPPPMEKGQGEPPDFSTVALSDVVRNIQEVVGASQAALSQAFAALDAEDTGFLKAMEFGDVLKAFCPKLTDSQYHYLLRKLRLHLTPHIHWKYFLENFGSFLEETADEWAEKMPKGPPPPVPRDPSIRETLVRLHKAVAACVHAITQEFENFDTMKTSTVSRDEFRAVCTRHIQILTDEQFDRLWSEMPVNAKGRLKYLDFLNRFSSEQVSTPAATGDSTRAQRGSSVPESWEGTGVAASSPTRDPRAGVRSQCHSGAAPSAVATPDSPPLQNCEPIESKLRKKLHGCWRELLRECKERDVNRHGEITAADFLALADSFGLDLNTEESHRLLLKYDLHGHGRFAYPAFLQSCVLLLQAKETSLLQRLRIQNAHKMKEAGAETASFYSALLRIQPQILHCWRPMRRTFKAYDESGSGLLSVADFRKVLRQYSINLSEEEFFHILEYYDKALSSKISYNDFLRAFLQ